MRSILKKGISIMLSLLLLLVFSLPCFATSYSNIFPSSATGLTGGAFLVGKSGNTNVTVLLPVDFKKGTFTFDSQGRVFNITNSTVTGRVYINNTVYNIRWQAFSYSQYYVASGAYYQWVDFSIHDISDTNIEFETSVSAWQNDSIYLDKRDIVLFSLLVAILFFVFLGWFLWHREH